MNTSNTRLDLAPAAEALPQTLSRKARSTTTISCRPRAAARLTSRGALLFAFLLLQAIIAVTLSGQEFRGIIIGSVSDPTGALIPNAFITAKGPQQVYTTKTNGSGNFAIPFVQPGTYTVTAEAKGFKRETREAVNIDVSQKVNLNFSLQVGAPNEEVTVKADAVNI